MGREEIENHLKTLGDEAYKERIQGYFKTGAGEYGEGDLFIGIRMPALRKEIRKLKDIPVNQMIELLQSVYHEVRMFALLLMVHRFKAKKTSESEKQRIYELYLENSKYVNNWDLVDSSAHHIVGPWLKNRDREVLYDLARSESIWERRIAVLTTFHYIDLGEYEESLRLAALLIHDREDLIHKAVGWMLRKIGNREREVEEEFLRHHYREMPRTMLRYAIEKFPKEVRNDYLKGRV